MRKVGAGKVALLCLGLAVSAAPSLAQTYKPAPTMEGGNWFRDWFSSPPQPEVKSVELERPTTKSDKAVVLQRLQKVLDRRRSVCDRLREIATETNDKALEAEANQLDEMAFQLYQTKSNRLLGLRGSTAAMVSESKPVRNGASDQARSNSRSVPESSEPTVSPGGER